MQLRNDDPLVDQMRATIRDCHRTVTLWEQDPTPTTPHEANMVACMTALAQVNASLTERLVNCEDS